MIFNKSSNGSAELKSLIGFIYASISYDNLLTYLNFAKRDLVRIIGKNIYKMALDFYNSEDYEAETPTDIQIRKTELVKRIQLPVALLAYRRYAPGSDLAHNDSGRQITVTDEIKPAFEWMIERDNKNITSLANEAIDYLLEYLDEQLIPYSLPPAGLGLETEPAVNDIGTLWGGTEEYSRTKDLFINTAFDFDRIFPINGSRQLFMTLAPFIREKELSHLVPVITRTRYDAIIEKIKDGDLVAQDKDIIRLAQPPLALLSMSTALMRLSMEVLPDSVVQNFQAMDAKQNHTADSVDRRGLSRLLLNEATMLLKPLQDYIAALTPVAATEELPVDTTQPYFMS